MYHEISVGIEVSKKKNEKKGFLRLVHSKRRAKEKIDLLPDYVVFHLTNRGE